MTAYIIVLGLFWEWEWVNLWGKIVITISVIGYLLLTLKNVYYNLKENKTENIEPTLCSYSRWKKEDLSNLKIDSYPFKKDLKTQIKNLLKYQENYDKIAKKSRDITRKGLYVLIIGLGLSIIINMIGIIFQIP